MKKIILIITGIIAIAMFGAAILAWILVPPLDNEKAIYGYNTFFSSLNITDLKEGHYKVDIDEKQCVFTNENALEYSISLNNVFTNDNLIMEDYYFFRVDDDNIYLYASGGIFTDDHEIVYLNDSHIDISYYTYIKKIDNNIYLCTLEKGKTP